MKNIIFSIGLFFQFIKNPFSELDKTVPYIKYFDGILLLFLPLVVLENFLLYWIGSGFNKIKLSFEIDNYFFFFYIIFLAPIFEEFIFRFSLKAEKRAILISSVSSSFYVLVRTKMFTESLMEVDYVLIGISIILFLLFFSKAMRNRIESKTLFYGLTLIFAVLHVFNYDLSFNHIPILLVSILSYLTLGFAFAFFRLKFSFLKALKIHIIYNTLTLLGLIIPYYLNSIG